MACVQTDFGCLPDNPVDFVASFYKIGLGFIGMVGLLFLIYGGYHILTSGGNAEQLQKGKEYILYAIIGILLAVFGFVFIEFIAGPLLQIPGFN